VSEFEEPFLSCVLLTPSILYKTKVAEGYFTIPAARQLFRAMIECSEKKLVIDYVSVNAADPSLDPTYAARVHDLQPSSANWRFYEGKIIDLYQRRKLVSLGNMLCEQDHNTAIGEYIERAEKELLALATGTTSTEIMSLARLLPGAIDKIKERYELKGKLPGLSTGLNHLDGAIGGLQAGRYYVIGARPSDGKSALAMNIACHISIRDKTPVGVISAESANDEIMTRIFSAEGRINGQRLGSGLIGKPDFGAIMEAGTRMHDAPMYLYDTPNIRFSELRGVARQMVAVYKCQALFIDYLQIVQWHNQAIAKHEQVAAISVSIKELARELKIPIIALSQLKRDAEGREPDMADLDYSKQIEQDADCIVLIYHPKVGEKEEAKPSMLLIKKNRDGPKGVVIVQFRREYVKFYEVEKGRK